MQEMGQNEKRSKVAVSGQARVRQTFGGGQGVPVDACQLIGQLSFRAFRVPKHVQLQPAPQHCTDRWNR